METQKCYKCPKIKKFQILDKCECGLVHCIKHRFHDCPLLSKKIILPEPVKFRKIEKI